MNELEKELEKFRLEEAVTPNPTRRLKAVTQDSKPNKEGKGW